MTWYVWGWLSMAMHPPRTSRRSDPEFVFAVPGPIAGVGEGGTEACEVGLTREIPRHDDVADLVNGEGLRDT